MRQILIFVAYLLAQAGFVGGGFFFAWDTLKGINGWLAFGFVLFLVFEAWMVFIHVVAPLMIWVKRADDRAWLKKRGHPHN